MIHINSRFGVLLCNIDLKNGGTRRKWGHAILERCVDSPCRIHTGIIHSLTLYLIGLFEWSMKYQEAGSSYQQGQALSQADKEWYVDGRLYHSYDEMAFDAISYHCVGWRMH